MDAAYEVLRRGQTSDAELRHKKLISQLKVKKRLEWSIVGFISFFFFSKLHPTMHVSLKFFFSQNL